MMKMFRIILIYFFNTRIHFTKKNNKAKNLFRNTLSMIVFTIDNLDPIFVFDRTKMINIMKIVKNVRDLEGCAVGREHSECQGFCQ